MSSPVYPMTGGRTVRERAPGAPREPACGGACFALERRQPFLTVPLLSSGSRRRFEVEGLHQIEARRAQARRWDLPKKSFALPACKR
jgi:hypothetical protein